MDSVATSVKWLSFFNAYYFPHHQCRMCFSILLTCQGITARIFTSSSFSFSSSVDSITFFVWNSFDNIQFSSTSPPISALCASRAYVQIRRSFFPSLYHVLTQNLLKSYLIFHFLFRFHLIHFSLWVLHLPNICSGSTEKRNHSKD